VVEAATHRVASNQGVGVGIGVAEGRGGAGG
jgi:hypothetical protein